ncbi:MAG: hypothetical protein RLZZ490_672 [Cyanobacteriota bacterium]
MCEKGEETVEGWVVEEYREGKKQGDRPEIGSKDNAQFTASLLETKKGITGTASHVRVSTATNLATGHILTNIGFSVIIV